MGDLVFETGSGFFRGGRGCHRAATVRRVVFSVARLFEANGVAVMLTTTPVRFRLPENIEFEPTTALRAIRVGVQSSRARW